MPTTDILDATELAALGAVTVPALTAVGDILAADSTTSFARIAAPAVGQVLTSNGVGVAPSWSASPTLTTLTTEGFVYIRGGADNRLLFGSSVDTSLSKVSAGVIGVGTGTQGSVAGTLQAATVIHGVGAASTPTLTFAGSSTTGFYKTTGNDSVSITSAGAAKIALGTSNANVPAVMLSSDTGIGWSVNSSADSLTPDLFIRRAAAATLQHGAADAASPVAQTIKFQDVVAGTTNTAGVNATIRAPAGTGTGAGGSLIFQVAPAGSSGTAKNAWVTALTIAWDKSATFTGNINLGAANWIASFGRGGIGFAGDGVFEIFSNGYASNVRITTGASNLATFNGGITAGSILTTTASTTARASLNIPSGVAPTTPTNGDIWSDGSDLKVRLGGVTYTLTKV